MRSLVRSRGSYYLDTRADSIHFRLHAEDTPLAPAALHSLCTLVKEKPDFNFGVNIMDIIVKRVGRKGWDDVSSHNLFWKFLIFLRLRC